MQRGARAKRVEHKQQICRGHDKVVVTVSFGLLRNIAMLEWFHDDFMSDGGSGGYSSEFNSEQEFESFDDYLEWPHNHSSHESVSLAAEYLRAPLSNPDFTCADQYVKKQH